MRRAIAILVVAAAMGSSLCVPVIYQQRQGLQLDSLSRLGRLPGRLLRAAALEFHGAVADLIFLRTITFVGSRLLEKHNLTPDEWREVTKLVDRITDLDPRFWDPYLFAEMTLPWDAGMVDEADRLLEKAARNRPGDFRPLYLLGFNAFFFEKHPEKAAPYLRRAAALPGAPEFLTGLATRMSYYGGQTEMGIAFLEGLLPSVTNQALHRHLEKRLAALTIMADLEKKVRRFRADHGRLPASLAELKETGYLETIPADPYGGEFVIMDNGRVYTTSKLVEQREEKP